MTNPTPEALAVSREDAVRFLESACRNWAHLEPLDNDDLDDVAGSLALFLRQRARAALAEGGEK